MGRTVYSPFAKSLKKKHGVFMLGKYTIVLPWESYGSHGFPSTGGKNVRDQIDDELIMSEHMFTWLSGFFFWGGGLKGLVLT